MVRKRPCSHGSHRPKVSEVAKLVDAGKINVFVETDLPLAEAKRPRNSGKPDMRVAELS